MATPLLLLFDGSCPVCRLLASLVAADAQPHWRFMAWQDFPDPQLGPPGMQLHPLEPRELALRTGEMWLEGEAAWQFLIEAEPRLRAFHGMAAKIGLSPPLSARWLRLIAHGLRRLCLACGPRSTLRNRPQS